MIIKLAAIGDVMFASPLVSNLKANFPEAQIHWLGDTWTKTVLDVIGLDKVLFYDRPGLKGSKIKGYLKLPLLINRLRKENYDLAIIPHRSNQSFRLAKAAGIPIKVGFIEKEPNKNLDVQVEYDSSKHEIERNLDLLRAFNLNVDNRQMVFNLDSDLIKSVKDRFLKDRKAGKLICISPGGGVNPGLSMPLKRWPKEYYLDLIHLLIAKDNQVVLVGSSADAKICDFIAQQSSALNLCARMSLKETAAIINQCDLYIGNDSGPLYIASAVGTPTIGIYGPTNPSLLAPLDEHSTYLINKTDCSPCYHPEATVQGKYDECAFDQQCMKGLTVEQVLSKVLEKFLI